ncbi:MAG: DNA-3-methyladenine glycosylase 2 family protein [Clostridia bacterium]|nr:DNA-3-methyladenine glycosylase 2 family protein [Clostridia bacterium]
MIRIHSKELDIRKIAESGQCFRLNEISKHHWQLIALAKILNIKEIGPYEYEFDCDEREHLEIWSSYFDLETDYPAMMRDVPKDDAFVNAALEFGKGMRILRQDPWEMLISFIVSQRKNISGIKKCIESLCLCFGEEIEGRGIYAFPTPKALAQAPEEAFCNCSLGYRLSYVRKAAQMVDANVFDLETTASLSSKELSDVELLSRLTAIPGVGPKVAQCVMLFGFHRLEAFPIDVWIDRVIKKYYNGSFPVGLYPGFAGVVQQYIFYYARKGKLEDIHA